MRHRNTLYTAVARSRKRWWMRTGILSAIPLVFSLMGCGPGEAEIFVNDVKKWFFNRSTSLVVGAEHLELQQEDGVAQAQKTGE